jgi:hypothetical protein
MPDHKLSFQQRLSHNTIMAVAALSLALVLATSVHAQPVKGIYGLPGYNFGAGGLIADAAGNLYGTAELGSTGNCIYGDQCGVVFELSPSASGWNPTVIYNFTGVTDGASPTTGVVFDNKGNLYGATPNTIYRLSPASGGNWAESTLYTFTGKSDGAFPTGPLAIDAAGNVYGTTNWGGSFSGSCSPNGCGVAFKLSPNADGSYTETTLHTFTGGSDGAIPVGGVMFVGQNLYGATAGGGTVSHCTSGCGVIFELVPSSSGWKEFVLHSFSGGSDGSNPLGTLVADSTGNLFGTTQRVAFELSHSSGKWQETVLYHFKADAVGYPAGGVVLDTAGNIYGESNSAYCQSFISSCGTAYELSNSSSGWTVSAHYRFGNNPSGDLLLDAAGNIFVISNGPSEIGSSVVFEITP